MCHIPAKSWIEYVGTWFGFWVMGWVLGYRLGLSKLKIQPTQLGFGLSLAAVAMYIIAVTGRLVLVNIVYTTPTTHTPQKLLGHFQGTWDASFRYATLL